MRKSERRKNVDTYFRTTFMRHHDIKNFPSYLLNENLYRIFFFIEKNYLLSENFSYISMNDSENVNIFFSIDKIQYHLTIWKNFMLLNEIVQKEQTNIEMHSYSTRYCTLASFEKLIKYARRKISSRN